MGEYWNDRIVPGQRNQAHYARSTSLFFLFTHISPSPGHPNCAYIKEGGDGYATMESTEKRNIFKSTYSPK